VEGKGRATIKDAQGSRAAATRRATKRWGEESGEDLEEQKPRTYRRMDIDRRDTETTSP